MFAQDKNQPSCVLCRSKTDLTFRTQVAIRADFIQCSDRQRHFGEITYDKSGHIFYSSSPSHFCLCSSQNPCLLTLTYVTQGRPSSTRRPLKHDGNIQKCCIFAQLSHVFISNMQTQRDKLLLDSFGYNLKKAVACSRTLFSEQGQEELHGKEGQYPHH